MAKCRWSPPARPVAPERPSTWPFATEAALGHGEAREVAVERGEAEAVVEDHAVAVDAEVGGVEHAPGVAGRDRRAGQGGEVVAVVDRLGDLLVARRSRCGARRSGSSPPSSPTARRARPRAARAAVFATISRTRFSSAARTRELISWNAAIGSAAEMPKASRELGDLLLQEARREVDALLREAALLELHGPARRGAVAGRVLGHDLDLRVRRRVARDRVEGEAAALARRVCARAAPGHREARVEGAGHVDPVDDDRLGHRPGDGARAAPRDVGEGRLDAEARRREVDAHRDRRRACWLPPQPGGPGPVAHRDLEAGLALAELCAPGRRSPARPRRAPWSLRRSRVDPS